jgi:hypothetical protein
MGEWKKKKIYIHFEIQYTTKYGFRETEPDFVITVM